MSKIVSLTAENIKRLSAVHIEPDGSLVVIGGRNKQGKTSVLDSIEMALGGKGSVPPKPVRKGKKKARTVVDLGELVVTRRFTEKDSYLSIETAEGEKPKSPQKILDELVGTLSFDPLDFSRMDAKEQAKVLREMVGLDTSDLDDKREEVFATRTDVNRELKGLKARLEKMARYPDAPKEEVSVAELAGELEKVVAHNAAGPYYERNLKEAQELEAQACRDVADLEHRLTKAKNVRAAAKEAVEAAENNLNEFEPQDEEALRTQLNEAEGNNLKVRLNAERRNVTRQAREKSKSAEALTAELEQIDEAKAERLAAIKMPVEGLAVADEQVTLDGIPFEQCSGSEQLRVSVAIGLALNPKLPVLLIRDGSLLDEDSMKMLAEMAEEADAQVWIERVGEGDETAVIIEDGAVKEESSAGE
jgi:recombinational DNA repair ATPase RecF